MSTDQIRERLHLLAAELPGLQEVEAEAREKLEETSLAVEDVRAEDWSAAAAGRLDVAVREWRQAEQHHQTAARAVEHNLRETARVREAIGQRGAT